MASEFPVCENCNQRSGMLYVLFPNMYGFPYLQVCKTCVSDIDLCVNNLKSMCDNDGKFCWTGKVADGSGELLWSEERGQIYKVED